MRHAGKNLLPLSTKLHKPLISSLADGVYQRLFLLRNGFNGNWQPSSLARSFVVIVTIPETRITGTHVRARDGACLGWRFYLVFRRLLPFGRMKNVRFGSQLYLCVCVCDIRHRKSVRWKAKTFVADATQGAGNETEVKWCNREYRRPNACVCDCRCWRWSVWRYIKYWQYRYSGRLSLSWSV